MKRLRFPLILLLVAGGIGGLVWKEAHRNTVRLSDGSQLTFCGLGVGTNRSHDYATLRDRIVARLPDQFGRKLRHNTVMHADPLDDNQIVFWFARHGGIPWTNSTHCPTSPFRIWRFPAQSPLIPARFVTNDVSMSDRIYAAVSGADHPLGANRLAVNLKDDAGDGEPGLRRFAGATLTSGVSSLYWKGRQIPQHSRTLVLCIYEHQGNSGWKCITKYQVPNPLYGHEP